MYRHLQIAIFTAPVVFFLIIMLGCSTSTDVYKDMSAEQIYNQGKQRAIKKRYSLAIKDYEALEARHPYGEFTDKAQLALIHAYHERDESASAIAAADRFIRVHPRHANVDYAYYMKGVVHYDENYSMVFRHFPLNKSKRDSTEARQAFDDFKVLVEKFPNSEYTIDARQRMIHLKNQLAEHELHVANYYFEREAYLAAANRASYIINQFDQTPSVSKALIVMYKSYNALGMEKLAADTRKLLEINYPDYNT